MPPPQQRWDETKELQAQLRRVHDAALRQEQKNRLLRQEIERSGAVLERRTRERDVAFEELGRYAAAPKYARLLDASRGPLEKKVRGIEAMMRDKRHELKKLAARQSATSLAEADIAADEYQHEIARLEPLVEQIAGVDAALRDSRRDAARRTSQGRDTADAEAIAEMYAHELRDLRRRMDGSLGVY